MKIKNAQQTSSPAQPASRTLLDLLYIKLQSLYDIECEIVKALPKMTAKATDTELKEDFRNHLKETRVHVERLEQAFKLLGKKPKKLKVEGIRGIIADAAWVMKTVTDKNALDASLIAAASYMEHYEIAGYVAACSWANQLGFDDMEDLLSATLREERCADDTLRNLGTAKINRLVVPMSEEELMTGVE